MKLINLPAIKIVHTSSIVSDPPLAQPLLDARIETHLHVKPVASGVWDDIKSVKAQTYKDTRGISIDQFQLLIDRIDRSTVMGKRDYAMLRLLWDNALRRAEVCGLDRR